MSTSESEPGLHTPFSVYVAGASTPGEMARVTAAIATLRAAEFEVVCTWPDVIGQVGLSNPRDASHVDRRAWSSKDLDEIDYADAVLFLVPTPPVTTRGAWFEAGYAFACTKHVVFAGDTRQSIFCSLAHEFSTDSLALGFLEELRNWKVQV